jgi:hypothetical protein
MKNPSIKDGVFGAVTEAFRKLPDVAVIVGAMAILFFLFAIALMAGAPD